ncbi:MAG: dihydropteroate synthase [Spirochaetes bacterium GWD1_27_9]|nr:MAG: dihydropteroate synthase [Spirochaetes bacterium GWB1_27_13]OHD27220.1 MAG: dihydropteroate synthase [Spirochaetes bacterium GWC1_27_15]OHD41225.1 MAG: dihydropteroate synthase [Spirochaetes bacterium GWD1_27_9]
MALLDFSNNKIYIMGILNVTPDSFSDGGKFNSIDKALFQVEKMIKDGADIIDVGGESTKPFAEPITLQEELDRVVPIIEKINKEFNTIISIDTYKSLVADESLKNGAKIINDISGFTFDSQMEIIAKKHNATCIIMHIKGTPKNMQIDPHYDNLILEIFNFLNNKVISLRNNGINDIIIDVGFGFGKNLNDNYKLLKNLSYFTKIGCPILAGISRKSMIGKLINIPPAERVAGTVSLNTIAILNGARLIRVHDVKENHQAVKTIEKYLEIDIVL